MSEQQRDAYKIFKEKVRKRILRMINLHAQHNKHNIDTQQWLETLHKHYSDRMLSDNERIWRTGALFVPISLASFVGLTAIDCLKFWHTIVLGFPFMALMWAWIVIAENHRSFQQKSEVWLIELERAMYLITPHEKKIEKGGREALVTKRAAVQNMRWALLYLVIYGWSIIISMYAIFIWNVDDVTHREVLIRFGSLIGVIFILRKFETYKNLVDYIKRTKQRLTTA